MTGMLAMVLWRRPEWPALLGRCVSIVAALQILLCLGQASGQTVAAERLGAARAPISPAPYSPCRHA